MAKQKNTFLAAIAYVLFFVPLLAKAKSDKFVEYHTKQGIGFFIFAAALRGVLAALGGPPYVRFGSTLSALLLQPAHLVLIVLIVIGMANAFKGETKPLPVIGKYAEKL
jgi:uncharacterized membrane protein